MPIVASNPNPKTSHGPLADRPLATASGVNGGDVYITTDAWPQRAYEVRLDETSTREWVELLTTESIIDAPATQVDIYVETTGSDTNDGLSVGTALLTLSRALLVAGRYQTRKVYIHLGSGIFDQPTCTTNSNGSVYFNVPTLAGGIGRTDVEPPIIQGTLVDAGTGTRTQLASAAGTAPTFTTVTDTAGGLTVSAHKGQWLIYTSGAASGRRFLIQDNTANVITLITTGATGAANGDTYTINDLATQVRWLVGGSPAQEIVWTGGVALYDQLQFTFTGGGVNMNVQLLGEGGSFTTCRFRRGDGATAIAVNAHQGVWSFGVPAGYRSETLYKPRGGIAYVGGVDFDHIGSITNTSASFVGLSTVRIDSGNVFASHGRVSVSIFALIGGSISSQAGGAPGAFVSVGRIDASPGLSTSIGGVTYRGVLTAFFGAYLRVNVVDISNTINASDEIVAAEDGLIRMTGIFSGTGNTGVPVRTGHMGQVQMDDPGVTQNCQGAVAGNDVVVGANAVTTYANIAAGASANICDYAAISPMFCVVRK